MKDRNTVLHVADVHKHFGGLRALSDVDLQVEEGTVHAIIGPNGAGKTTLIAQLSGELRSDGGSIRFAGEDVTALPVYDRSRRGLARSFQITSVFRAFTALENVALALQAHDGHSFSFWKDATRDPALIEPARRMLEQGRVSGR